MAAAATLSPAITRVLLIAALAGLGFAAASTSIHYRILNDPLYSSSICDISVTVSCTEAYTSRFGSIAGVPVALIGVLYFAFVIVLITLCQRSATARQNLPGYVFAVSTAGLAGVLYLAYASFVVLKAVCLLCVGSYAAIITLFLVSGMAERSPMKSLPSRASRDVRTLLGTPAALASVLGFIAIAAVAVMMFPGGSVSASSDAAAAAATPAAAAPAAPTNPRLAPPATNQLTAAQQAELEQFLSSQPRVSVPAGGSGAAVVIVKFNDYQCPPCGATFREYKPVIAQLQQEHPGKIAFVTKDFPLESECNSLPGMSDLHTSACEAAASVRLAREKGKADAMEEWLFANQQGLTPDRVREAVSTVAGVADFPARYTKTLELVRGDIAQGIQLGVRGTPTFFMNGIRMQTWPGYVFKAAVEWELRRVASK